MSDLTQFIIENTASGLIDKKIGTELLKKALKLNQSQSNKEIAVIGIAVKLPGADDLAEFWHNLMNGVDNVSQYPLSRRKDTDEIVAIYGNLPKEEIIYREGGYLREIDKFDYKYFNLSPKEASLMDPHHRIFMETAVKAIEDAGYGGNKLIGSNTGVYLGYNSGPIYGYFVSQVERDSIPVAATGNIPALTGGRLAYYMDFKGPSVLINTACSSSLVALHLACRGIRNGDCDQAIVAGVKLELSPVQSLFYVGIDSPEGRTATFDERANGTTWGEGAIVILIKPLAKAIKDNDHIYAVIKGSAVNQDGATASITAPNSKAQAELIISAWKDADIDPETISYIEAHGTGTKLGDPIEIDGIQKAFRKYTDKKQFCAVGSVKTNIGHLDSAAGLAGFVKAVLALQQNYIPPTLNFNIPNRKINFERSPVFVNDRLLKWEKGVTPRRCGVSSFGFSGTNCHVVLEEAPAIESHSWNMADELHVLTISAKTESAFRDLIARYRDYIAVTAELPVSELCYTANTGRGHYTFRLAVIVSDAADLKAKMAGLDPFQLQSDTAKGLFCNFPGVASGNRPAAAINELKANEQNELTARAVQKLKQYPAASAERYQLLAEICDLYIKGATIPWEDIYREGKYRKISLPTYSFERSRCWLDLPQDLSPGFPESDIYYTVTWRPSAETETVLWACYDEKIMVIYDQPNGQNEKGPGITRKLRSAGKTLLEVQLGQEYQKIGEGRYLITGSCQDYEQIFGENNLREIARIILITNCDGFNTIDSIDTLARTQQNGVYNLVYLFKALNHLNLKHDLEIILITGFVHQVTGTEIQLNPENATLIGLGKTAGLENIHLKCRAIDIDGQTDIETIINEINLPCRNYLVAYRAGQRYVPQVDVVDLNAVKDVAPAIKEGGVYIITGGTGGIGLEVARFLADAAKVKLCLINRSAIPERAQWDEILLTASRESKLRQKIETIKAIEQSGSEVSCFSADVADFQAMATVIAEIRNRYGRIHGIFHSAGVAGNGFLVQKPETALREVFNPKVNGTLILDWLTREDELDFMILFSSIAALIGGPGQGDYTAANSFLDSFAAYRNKRGQRTVSINWPAWKETGMAVDLGANTDGVFKAISTSCAVNALKTVLNKEISQVIIAQINFSNISEEHLNSLPFSIAPQLQKLIGRPGSTTVQKGQINAKPHPHPVKVVGKNTGEYLETEKLLAQIWSKVLGYQEINVNDNFFEIGGDSILLMTVHRLIEEQFPGKVSLTDLFAYPTITKLTEFIGQKERPLFKIPIPDNRPAAVNDAIAIIGMAVSFPGAADYQQFWDNIKNSVDSVHEFPGSRKSDADVIWSVINPDKPNNGYNPGGYLAEIDKFDYRFFRLSPKEACLMDPNQRLFLENVWATIEDAGYGGIKLAGSKTGIFVGYNNWPLYGQLINRIEPLAGTTTPGNISSLIPSRISYLLDLKGPALLVDTACSSSLVAVHLACQSIYRRECTMAVAGGIRINILPIKDNNDIGIQSATYRTKTFDEKADGTVWGEGVASILLKPLSQAVSDGDHIYAVIKGSAVNQDGSSIGITAPNVLAQEEVIVDAWQKAGIDPDTISYIEAHGTGTSLGDPIEIDALKRSFQRFTDKKQFCAIGSLKPNIGHLDCAAGLAGLIKAALALYYREIPPSIHFNLPNRKIGFEESPFYVNNTLRPWETDGIPRRCGVSSFGISGTNCHIVLEEAPRSAAESGITAEGLHILTLSAKSEKVLQELISRYQKFMAVNSGLTVAEICYTANTGRGHYEYRLAMIVTDITDLKDKIARLNAAHLAANNGGGLFYNYHHVVPGNYRADGAREITESRRQELTALATQKITELPAVPVPTNLYGQLAEICDLYVKGADIPWDEFYRGRKYRRVVLPVYPFERNRCWLEIPEFDMPAMNDRGLFYDIHWKPDELTAPPAGTFDGKFLIIKPQESNRRILEICDSLAKQGKEMIHVTVGNEFQKISGGEYVISGGWEDYRKIFADIRAANLRIIHLLTVKGAENPDSLDNLLKMQFQGVYSLINLVKALDDPASPLKTWLIIVAENTNEVTGGESWLAPENAPFLTLGKFIGLEYPAIQCRCIDIDEITTGERLALEFMSPSPDRQVAYREGRRYVPEVTSKDLAGPPRTGGGIKEDGVYIITGGTGGIGLEIGKYLAAQNRVKLILLNRSRFPDRRKWNQIIAEENNAALIKKINALREIEASGAVMELYSVDIAVESELKEVLDQVRAKYGKINGIIHCAGVATRGRMIADQNQDALWQVMAAKLQGTWLLDHLTRRDPLDFFIMFSSVATIAGGVGGGDYIAANAYLDAYASYRNKYRPGTVVINWPMWNDTGMLEGAMNNIDETRQMFKVISVASAVTAFDQILRTDISRVMVGRLNFESPIFGMQDLLPFRLSEALSGVLNQTPKSGSTRPVNRLRPVRLTGRADGRYSELERQLAEFWRDYLGFEEININDSFVEMGGDSIHALRIVNGINETLKIDTKVSELLACDNIRDYAQLLQTRYLKQPADELVALFIPPVAAGEIYEVSSAQKRIYILSRLEPGSVSYNMPGATIIEGKLDIHRLEAVFHMLIQRHEVFRTSFTMVDGEPRQKIHPEVEFAIRRLQADEAEIPDVIAAFIRPFDFNTAPLLRVGLIKVHDHKHVLIYDMHHIIADGTSLNIMIQEFIQLYNGMTLPELKIQYKDFAAWQNRLRQSDRIKKQEEYWLQLFSGELPVLNLPLDYPRPATQSFEGARIRFETGEELTRKINRIAVEAGTTLYNVLLSAFNILLSKYTGQEDLIIGTPVVGRPHTQLEKIIGMFANTLALRNYPAGDKPFRNFLAEVKLNSLRSFENQDYQFEELIEKLDLKRDLSRNPLFDVMFVLQNAHKISEAGGLRFIPYEYETKTAKFDLLLEAIEDDQTIHFNIEYCAKLFTRETIIRMAGHFTNILTAIAAQPECCLKDLELLTAAEKRMILTGFNDTQADYPKEKTIHELFAEQAERTPDAIAVIYQEQQLTYGTLNRRSNQLARRLRKKGVKPNQLIGIIVERSPEMIIGIMAILKAGGAYLPISPDYPAERINYMLQDGCVNILLTKRLTAHKAIKAVETVIYLEDAKWYTGDGSNPAPINNARDLAYCIYTSGSTGNPKGVTIAHYSLVNRLNWMQKQYPIDNTDVILQKTPYTFDVSLWELFWWSFTGAKVSLLAPGGEKDPETIVAAIEKDAVTTIHFVPSMLNAFLEYSGGNIDLTRLKSLKRVFASGEALTVQQVRRFQKLYGANSRIKLYNLYGPTEATVDVSFFDCSTLKEGLNTVPIGKPIDNTQLYIVDQYHRLQPVGVPGELCIAGDGLARGYWGQPELTAQKFVPNPFIPGARMYLTGDLARWLPDGNIEFLGRRDFQVKIRGFRIELGEIEARLLKHEAVRELIVIAGEDENSDKYLCAYFTADRELMVQDLRDYLAGGLPEYMIPSYFIQLDKLPLTPNGKIDRKALPKPQASINTGAMYEAPRNEIEAKLLMLWQTVLGIEKIGINDNFFELGGHSLKAIHLVSGILKEFNREIPLSRVFKSPTIRELAQNLAESDPSGYDRIPVAPRREYYQLSSAQKRMYIMSQLETALTNYNTPGMLTIEGKLDYQRLKQAFNTLIQRHDSLRTAFRMHNGEPVQIILEQVDFQIEFYEPDGEVETEKLLKAFIRPFDLTQAPLLRVGLIKTGAEKHILIYDMHHIITDAVSMGIFIRELAYLYQEKPLPEQRIQYKDFVVWQNESSGAGVIQKQEQYWLQVFSGAIPVLNIITDYRRPAKQSFAGNTIEFEVEPGLTGRLNKLALESGATLYMVLLAAYNLLLAKYTGQEDIIIGAPVVGRRHPDLKNVFGMFVNMLALRNYPQGGKTFAKFLEEVRDNALQAYENQDYQFEELVGKLNLKRDLSRNPLCDTVFSMENVEIPEIAVENIKLIPFEIKNNITKFDLLLIARESGAKIAMKLQYATALFKQATIERMAGHYLEILTQIAADKYIVLNEVKLANRFMEADTVLLYEAAGDFEF